MRTQVLFNGDLLTVEDAKAGGDPRWAYLTPAARVALSQLHANAVAHRRTYLVPPEVFVPPRTATAACLDRCARAAVKAAREAWADAQVKAGLHDHGAAWAKRYPEAAAARAAAHPDHPILWRHFRARYRLHDLRHTCATLMVVAGWNIEEVRKRLGHAGLDTTQRYTKAAGELGQAPGVKEYADTHYAPPTLTNFRPTRSPEPASPS